MPDRSATDARAAPTGATASPRAAAMQLTVWLDAAADWHARVVVADGSVHEFTNPFLLARFVSQAVRRPSAPGAGGLR